MISILLIEKIAFYLGLVYYCFYIIYPEYFTGMSLSDDPMSVMGFGLILITNIIARLFQSTFIPRFSILFRAQIIKIENSFHEFKSKFSQLSSACIVSTGFLLVPSTLAILATLNTQEVGKFHLIVGSLLGGILITTRVGWGIATGILAFRLKTYGIRISPMPFAKDKLSGLELLGQYYFKQALISLVPALSFIFWIIGYWLNWNLLNPYGNFWQDLFMFFLFFNILVVFNLTFLLPIIALHREMKKWKLRCIRIIKRSHLDNHEVFDLNNLELRNEPAEFFAKYQTIREYFEIIDEIYFMKVIPVPMTEKIAAVIANISAVIGVASVILS
ncbi:MAG: hypothetical protein KAG89_02825 [Fulvimarina manganoxydans]|uniref:hypothetical protein n=1 Tax=Fulvimarina manganoxydans TaxID=937218 RepID=UPI002356843E|nr:hypothetical protein [Fulvimarina manganoxydans]MCK5931080.1 hypothetical protein [Fulvimarina manganoxydans]